MYFKLRKRFEPGSPGFPQGGFEVFGPDGGIYNFMLDEVIVHPFHLGMKSYFSKAQNAVKEKVSTGVKGKRGRPKIDPSLKKTLPASKSTHHLRKHYQHMYLQVVNEDVKLWILR
jgi:hypothetical protein